VPPTIAMLVPHEPDKDPRIHWEASTAGKEFETVVLGLQENPDRHPDEETRDGYRIVRERWSIGADGRLRYLSYLARYLLSPAAPYLLLALGAVLYPFCFIIEFAMQFVLRVLGLVFGFFESVLDRMATYGFLARLIARKWEALAGRHPEPAARRHANPLRLKAECFLLIQRRLFHTTFALLRAYEKSGIKADLVHCNDLDTLLAGVILKEKTGCRLVYDAHELWPVSFPDYPGSLVFLLRYFEKKLIRHVDNAFIVSPDLASIMKKWYGFDKIGVLPNAEIYNGDGRALDTGMRKLAGNRAIFLFQGGYAKERGLEELIKGWQGVDGSRAALFLRGMHNTFEDELRELAGDQCGEGRIFFMPPVSEEDLVAASREADVGIIPYRPVSLNNRFCCPNKFSQYLQAGLALLVNDLPYLKSCVERFECGLSYDSSSPDTFIKAVMKLTEDWNYLNYCKKSSMKAGRESFNWDIVGAPLVEAYKELLSDKIKTNPLKEVLMDFQQNPQQWRDDHYNAPGAGILGRLRKEGSWAIPPSGIEKIRGKITRQYAERAAETIRQADLACAGQFTVLGAGPFCFRDGIDWSSDLDGRSWMKGSFTELRRRIYENFPHNGHVIGDIKVPWDLNKHLHFFDLARAYTLTGDEKYPREFRAQIESWWEQNPFTRNLAWMEPLIVAQRALSWLFAMRFLIGSEAVDEEFHTRFMASLYNHLQWIQKLYEIEDRSTNHLIGNIAGVLAITSFYPEFDISGQSEERALNLLVEQVGKQIHPDGTHYEQSVSYHRYVLEFLLSIALVFRYTGKEVPAPVREKTEKAAEYLMHMLSPDGQAHLISDADGARVFRLGTSDINDYRPHLALSAALFNNPRLAHQAAENTEILAWALGPDAALPEPEAPQDRSRWFRDGGMVVMRSDWSAQAAQLTFDCGNIGLGYTDELPHGTHGHDDLLSITLSCRGRQALADRGSGSYTGNLAVHEALRLSMGHNTVSLAPPSDLRSGAASARIESHSVPMGPWVLGNRARPLDAVFFSCEELEYATCSHDGYRRLGGAPVIKRSIFYFRPEVFIIVDQISFTGRSSTSPVYVKMAVPFHFHPDMTVRFDERGGAASAEGVCLRYAVAQMEEEWNVSYRKGCTEPYTGWHAKDYGCLVPAPSATYECIVTPPSRSAMIIRCDGAMTGEAPAIRWMTVEDGEKCSAIEAVIGDAHYYIWLEEKGMSAVPHQIRKKKPSAIGAAKVRSGALERSWIVGENGIEEIVP